MKRICVIVLLIMPLLYSTASGISEDDYKKLKNSRNFNTLENVLLADVQKIQELLPSGEKEQFAQDFQDWLDFGQDVTADNLMNFDGLSVLQAYTAVYQEKFDSVLAYLNQLKDPNFIRHLSKPQILSS